MRLCCSAVCLCSAWLPQPVMQLGVVKQNGKRRLRYGVRTVVASMMEGRPTVSSDDIVRRMELMDVPPGSYDEETLYDAVDEIKRLREMAYHRGEQLARAWVVGVTGATEVDPIVDPDEQAWSAMTGDHSPETLADTLIDQIHRAQSEIERLRAERDMLADALTAQVSPDLSAKTARLLFRNAIAELERRHG